MNVLVESMYMEKKLVSVVIPVYNAQNTLHRCIDSIREQNYKDLQIILIDDGSTDKSGKICDEYAAIDARICVVHKENGGVCSARNAGLELVKGEYVTFADNDDFILQGMYSRMVMEMENKGLDVCISHFLNGTTDCNVASIPHAPKLPSGVYDSYEIERLLFMKNWYQSGLVCAIWNKIYKYNVVKNVRFSGLWGEDYEFNDFINSKHLTIGIIDEAYYVWCYNSKSQSHQDYKPLWNGLLTVIRKREELFSDDKEISNKSKEMYCNQFVENKIVSRIKGYGFPKQYALTFSQYVSALKKDKVCTMKWYFRMKIFQISPSIYYLLTRKTWMKYITKE